jgi:hypothetical protein
VSLSLAFAVYAASSSVIVAVFYLLALSLGAAAAVARLTVRARSSAGLPSRRFALLVLAAMLFLAWDPLMQVRSSPRLAELSTALVVTQPTRTGADSPGSAAASLAAWWWSAALAALARTRGVVEWAWSTVRSRRSVEALLFVLLLKAVARGGS